MASPIRDGDYAMKMLGRTNIGQTHCPFGRLLNWPLFLFFLFRDTLLWFAPRLAELHLIVRLGRHAYQRAHNELHCFHVIRWLRLGHAR